MKEVSILITGVGGQGTLLASRILGDLAQRLRLDVKVSEVHGMAQRGGSVVTYVRMGEKVYSPVIDPGTADVLLSFEFLEALRSVHMLKDGGTVVVNAQEIMPMPVVTGAVQYPADIVEQLQARPVRIVPVDALSLAQKSGNTRTVNTALMGALARTMEAPLQTWMEAIDACVPPRTRDVNKAAFLLGYEAGGEKL